MTRSFDRELDQRAPAATGAGDDTAAFVLSADALRSPTAPTAPTTTAAHADIGLPAVDWTPAWQGAASDTIAWRAVAAPHLSPVMAVAAAPEAVATPAISVADLVVSEGDGFVDVVVTLSDAGTNTVTVNYATQDVSADDGGFDYTAASGTLTFAPGETSKTVRITLSQFSGLEGAESFRLNLSAPTNSTIAKSSSLITIIDNDNIVATPDIFVRDVIVDEKAGTATFVVILGGPAGQASAGTVRVDYATGASTTNASATAGADYTATSGTLVFQPGQTVKTVVVNLNDDNAAEGVERFNLNLSNAVNGTIRDGRGEAVIGASDGSAVSQPRISVSDAVVSESDGWVDIVVSLSAPGQNAVSVNYATADVSADDGGFDYFAVSGTINFAVGETTKVVRVSLAEFSGVEGLESFRFNLSGAVNATIAQASASVQIVDDDTIVATPGLFVRDVVVDEQAGTATFVVLLGGPRGQASNSTVTVDYATGGSNQNASATAGSDYRAQSGTLTFAPGETVKTVVVDISNDADTEGAERFNLNLSNAQGATILDGRGTALIGANDGTASSQPRITVSDMVVSEADGWIDVVVSLSAPGQNAVSVAYGTQDISADDGGFDYFAVSGTLNFAVGETTKVVRIELAQYSGVEALESFRFNLSGAVNATIAQASASVQIVDNDVIVDTPNLFVRDVVVDEKAGTATFTVLLGGPDGQASNSTVTVDYASANSTSNTSATAGNDYQAVSGTLTFAPGETVKTVVVDITDDGSSEGAERFNLNLSNAVNATILDGQGVALIGLSDGTALSSPRLSVSDVIASEEDGWVDVVVSLNASAQNVVTVNYGSADVTADDGGFDYFAVAGTLNFAVGETTKVVRVELAQYSGDENLESFRFNLSNAVNATIARSSAVVSIVDNDTIVETPGIVVRDVTVDERDGSARFTVLLGGPKGEASNSAVTVNYATANGTAGGSDYGGTSGTLTFAPGETVKTVVIDISDDAAAEGSETFALNLANASGAVILDNQGIARIGSSDGTALTAPRIGVSDAIVSEADGYVDIVVSLSAPGQNTVTVAYTTADSTADDGAFDYVGASGTLNFAAGETTKVVRVELSEFSGIEAFESFRFNLSSATNATIAKPSTLVSIIDNDTLEDTPKLFVRDATVDESAGTATFTVLLGGPSGAASNSVVTVDYATSNGSAKSGNDYSAANGTLTFAPGETAKTITVELGNDTAAEALERFNLSLSNAGNATIADGNAVAKIGNSDGTPAALPVIQTSPIIVAEGDGYVDIAVSLSAPGQNVVTVAYTTANATGTSGFDYIGSSGTLNFAVGETTKVVRVELVNGITVESLETFNFNLSAAVNATIGNTSTAISIVDNDTAGINVLSYGDSDDVYTVVAGTDQIVENPNGGNDTVRSGVTYTLGSEVEDLTLTGGAGVNGNGNGNALKNIINGNSGGNNLKGQGGADTINGGGGGDNINGGSGADVLDGGSGGDTLTGGSSADAFVFGSALASDGVTDFVSGSDGLRITQSGITIGDGDAVVEGAVTRAGPGGFANTAELVVITTNITGAITAASAAAAIGSASSAYTVGSTVLFAVDNGSDSALFRFEAANANAAVSASELTQLASLTGTAAIATGDVSFVGAASAVVNLPWFGGGFFMGSDFEAGARTQPWCGSHGSGAWSPMGYEWTM
jgi:Ca2+-binding RTX toxin-like protein